MLPTTKTEKETDPRNLAVFIYGRPGVGKTTFVSGLFGGNVLFLDTEKGTKGVSGFIHPIKSWQDFKDAVLELHKNYENYDFQGVAIDTVDALRDLCVKHVCAKIGATDETHRAFSGGYGRGWQMVNREFRDGINLLFSGNWGVFFVSHEKEEEQTLDGRAVPLGEKADGPTVVKVVPSIARSQRGVLLPMSDVVLRATILDDDARALLAAPTKHLTAKDRTGILPPVFKLCPETYAGFFREVVRKKKATQAQ